MEMARVERQLFDHIGLPFLAKFHPLHGYRNYTRLVCILHLNNVNSFACEMGLGHACSRAEDPRAAQQLMHSTLSTQGHASQRTVSKVVLK